MKDRPTGRIRDQAVEDRASLGRKCQGRQLAVFAIMFAGLIDNPRHYIEDRDLTAMLPRLRLSKQEPHFAESPIRWRQLL
jgi:hypothetical protein